MRIFEYLVDLSHGIAVCDGYIDMLFRQHQRLATALRRHQARSLRIRDTHESAQQANSRNQPTAKPTSSPSAFDSARGFFT